MRGLVAAGLLLAAPLASGAGIVPQENTPSAFITVDLPGVEIDDKAAFLSFRLDVLPSQTACGSANVTLNGVVLPASSQMSLPLVPRFGQDSGDGDHGSTKRKKNKAPSEPAAAVVQWDASCVSWGGEDREQLLQLRVLSVNGLALAADTDAEEAGSVTVRFRQTAPARVVLVEGAASVFRFDDGYVSDGADDAREAGETGETSETDEFAADTDISEFAAWDTSIALLHHYAAVLRHDIRLREQYLVSRFGRPSAMAAAHHHRHHGHGASCSDITSFVGSVFHKIAGTARALYGDLFANTLGEFADDGRGPPLGPPHGPPPPPPPPPPGAGGFPGGPPPGPHDGPGSPPGPPPPHGPPPHCHPPPPPHGPPHWPWPPPPCLPHGNRTGRFPHPPPPPPPPPSFLFHSPVALAQYPPPPPPPGPHGPPPPHHPPSGGPGGGPGVPGHHEGPGGPGGPGHHGGHGGPGGDHDAGWPHGAMDHEGADSPPFSDGDFRGRKMHGFSPDGPPPPPPPGPWQLPPRPLGRAPVAKMAALLGLVLMMFFIFVRHCRNRLRGRHARGGPSGFSARFQQFNDGFQERQNRRRMRRAQRAARRNFFQRVKAFFAGRGGYGYDADEKLGEVDVAGHGHVESAVSTPTSSSALLEQEIAEFRVAADVVGEMIAAEEGRLVQTPEPSQWQEASQGQQGTTACPPFAQAPAPAVSAASQPPSTPEALMAAASSVYGGYSRRSAADAGSDFDDTESLPPAYSSDDCQYVNLVEASVVADGFQYRPGTSV